MYKILVINLLLFIPVFCFSQNGDSLTSIIKIDKLLDEAQLLVDSQSLELAFKKLTFAKSICLKKFGMKSTMYCKVGFKFASYYEASGDYVNAEKWYQTTLDLYEQIGENNNLEYANTLNAFAGICTDIGQIEKAKYLYESALAIRAIILGKEHPKYAAALNNLAGIYQFQGEYDSAIILFKEVQGIFFKSFGTESLQFAQAGHNLANVYFEIGNYNEAESLYRESLAIREKINGRVDPLCAASLNCLGNLYLSMGNKEYGLNYYQEALLIYTNTEGQKSLNTAACMTNIARIFYEMGQFDTAETNYLKALEIYGSTIGKESPDYAMCIDNLANMYAIKKDYSKVEQLYLEALKIRETVFGINHTEYGISLNNLGSYYSNLNESGKAESYLLKSQKLWEQIFGREHPDYLLALNNLISHFWLIGNFSQIESKLTESVQIEKNLVFRASKHLSENELSKYISSFSSSLDRLFSFNSESMKLNGICYNSLLFYKSYLLNSNVQLRNLIHRDSMHVQLFNKIKVLHQKLSKELSLPTADRSIDNVKSLEEEINFQEKELQKKVLGSVELHKDVTYQEILNSLKPDEAAIEFVHYNFVNPTFTGKINYAALILKPGLKEPVFIPLCDQNSLDSLLHSSMERRADYVNSLYSISERGVKTNIQWSRNLSELIWKPLEQHLAGIKTIYYSSSGLFHRINFDAIPINELATLSDSFQLIAHGSTRQLLRPVLTDYKNNTAVLFGGINFDQINQSAPSNHINNQQDSGNNQETDLMNSSVNSWEFLSGTEREVDALDKILLNVQFKTSKLKGVDATEASIKRIGHGKNGSPRILHFATHGYFFPDRTSEGTAKAASPRSKLEFETNEPVFKLSDHPMLRSGLIMAGGNAAWQGKAIPEGNEDGILTAYEISQMNLSNTELVVLSACETGLGDIQGNEGVYGLQRAFKIAGAKYLIMSLWQVPDKQTSLLMTTFYKKWLESHMSIPNAFHAAQKDLRELGLDPYQWAGFVLVE